MLSSYQDHLTTEQQKTMNEFDILAFTDDTITEEELYREAQELWFAELMESLEYNEETSEAQFVKGYN